MIEILAAIYFVTAVSWAVYATRKTDQILKEQNPFMRDEILMATFFINLIVCPVAIVWAAIQVRKPL